MLGFTFIVSLLAGCLAGLAPMWYAMRTNLNEALKAGGRSDSGKGGHRRVRSVLVVAEVALSLVLLIGAGLMVRSFVALVQADIGIKHDPCGEEIPCAESYGNKKRWIFISLSVA